MSSFVTKQNIARFRGLLQSTRDPGQRKILSQLLAEEEAKDRQPQKEGPASTAS
jgi:hypothetical protein